ncbi:hypothetical protein EAH79_07380 [Sphingomonas koreensis]|nr:hypothetical protein EAH79_07380 [Sphingomonas koreensis]
MTSAFAVLDIHRTADGALPEEVIRLAYKASRRVRIALLLDDISPADIDRLLDPLVKQCRLDIPGLIYLDRRHPPCELDVQFDFADPAQQREVVYHRRIAPGAASAAVVLARLARATRCDEATES